MDWQLQADGLDITVSLWPTLLAWAGPALCLPAAALLALRPGGPSMPDGLVASALCALLALACPAALVVSLHAFDPAGGVWIPGTPDGLLLTVVDGAAPALAFLLIGAGLLAHFAREGGASRLVLLSVLPGPGIALVGLGHGIYLTFSGGCPTLDAPVPARTHVGADLRFPVASREGWSTPELSMPRDAAGERCADAVGTRPGLSARRAWCWEVGEDRGVAWLELAEGNRWTWIPTTERRDQVLWIIPSRQRFEGPAVTVEVRGAEVRDGLSLHTVRLSSEGREEDWLLYGWNGQVHRHLPAEAGERRSGARARSADLPYAWTLPGASALGAPTAGPLLDCRVAWFPDALCGCTDAPTADVPLPGALLCHSAPGGSTAETVTSLLTTVLTGGLVILDPDARTTWMLRSSARAAAETPAGER